MAELSLSHDQIIALRARAHALGPVVLMGAAGLSAAVVKEIDRALLAHGLIKVRAARSEREERDALFLSIAEQLGAARIQCIGSTFVLFRPVPAAKAPAAARKARPAPAGRSPGGKSPGAKSIGATARAPAKALGGRAGLTAELKKKTQLARAGATGRTTGRAGARAVARPAPRARTPAGGPRQR